MHKVRITVMARAEHKGLMEKYELPMEQPCDMVIGQTYISEYAHMPAGMCHSAWTSLQPFVFALANGAEDFFDGWMRDRASAMVSCNDGFRPVSFLLERID